MFLDPSDTHLLLRSGFKYSEFSNSILYGTSNDGKRWQVEETANALMLREVTNYRLGAPARFSESFLSNFQ